MVGCSLTEAFPDTTEQSGKIARKEERRRAKTCKGPALSFLQQDPDRQAERPPPPPEKLRTDGFADFKTEGVAKDLIGKQVDDVIGAKGGRVLPKATTTTQLSDSGHTAYGDVVPSYFGKGGDSEDGFADFNKSLSDNRGYTVDGSDFMKGFNGKGLDKATGGYLPLPSLNDNWKPISPGGVQSSFYPATSSKSDDSFSKEEKETLLKKLDTLFARLEELETKRNEYAHAEVTLFILSGLFLMFSLETMRKFR
jgi:hypothetical protein